MVTLPDKPITRTMIDINGIVQGVGFRPFVYNLARSCRIRGWVNNFPGGVHIDAEGSEEDLAAFISRLQTEAPLLSSIDTFRAKHGEPVGYTDFTIRESGTESTREAYISSDIAVCPDCLREMNDPENRRYGYAFINCTNCGPRFTITEDIPYDRVNTTMRRFPMCPECAAEYGDPSDRRFHAQPVACPKCGPALSLLDADGNTVCRGGEVEKAVKFLRAGRIIAIKGLGGYHLACDAKNGDAVRELRRRKNRDGKPFALMARDIGTVRTYCAVSQEEFELLQGIQRPIVLLGRAAGATRLSGDISRDNSRLGVMLPYTPLHHLLLSCGPDLLVMTSGNQSGEPICYRDEEALSALGGIADYFLTHNRDIHIRTDDSVTSVYARKEYIIRRSRGYAPLPLDISAALGLPKAVPSILACGGELKNTFCLTKGTKAFLSHHIGDLGNLETLQAFENGVEHFKTIFSITPEAVAYDMHPGYLSTQYADKLDGIIKIPVQHHRAHIAACMAENGVVDPVIGVAFDGTGYGDDGSIWGGEFFTGEYTCLERRAHFEYIPLPGGEAAVREPWRMALSYFVHAFGADGVPEYLPSLKQIDPYKAGLVLKLIDRRLNAPLTSSAGRLFDAVSALLGLCPVIDYEGQAAIRLERVADPDMIASYPYDIVPEGAGYRIGVSRMIAAIADDVKNGRQVSRISGAFHKTVAGIIRDVCGLLRDKTGIGQVALSGGVFQNRLLLELATAFLTDAGFCVLLHSRVPPNDGGISLGQAVIAAKILMTKGNEAHG